MGRRWGLGGRRGLDRQRPDGSGRPGRGRRRLHPHRLIPVQDGRRARGGERGRAGGSGSAGDFDNDGDDDLLAGAPKDDAGGASSGGAWLFEGPLHTSDASITLTGAGAGDEAGNTVGALDADGDGFAELVVGASYAGPDKVGEVYVVQFPSASSSLSDAPSIRGDSPQGRFGASVLGGGDLTGDGYDDLLVTERYADDGSFDGGACHLFSGGSSTLSPDDAWASWLGHVPNAGLQAVATGELTGDEHPELVMCADAADAPTTAAGLCMWVQGPLPSGVHDLAGASGTLRGSEHERLGTSIVVAPLDDQEGDDLLIGAPRDDGGAGTVWLLGSG